MYVMLELFLVVCSDLSSERQRHSTSARQSRKLHTQVQQLGQELGVAKQEKEQVRHVLSIYPLPFL